jgi:hypothetical protein
MYLRKGAGTPLDTNQCSCEKVKIEIKGDEGLEARDGGVFQILYTTRANDPIWYVDSRIKGLPNGFTVAIRDDVEIEMIEYASVLALVLIMVYVLLVKYNKKPINKALKYILISLIIALIFSSAHLLYMLNNLRSYSADLPEVLSTK